MKGFHKFKLDPKINSTALTNDLEIARKAINKDFAKKMSDTITGLTKDGNEVNMTVADLASKVFNNCTNLTYIMNNAGRWHTGNCENRYLTSVGHIYANAVDMFNKSDDQKRRFNYGYTRTVSPSIMIVNSKAKSGEVCVFQFSFKIDLSNNRYTFDLDRNAEFLVVKEDQDLNLPNGSVIESGAWVNVTTPGWRYSQHSDRQLKLPIKGEFILVSQNSLIRSDSTYSPLNSLSKDPSIIYFSDTGWLTSAIYTKDGMYHNSEDAACVEYYCKSGHHISSAEYYVNGKNLKHVNDSSISVGNRDLVQFILENGEIGEGLIRKFFPEFADGNEEKLCVLSTDRFVISNLANKFLGDDMSKRPYMRSYNSVSNQKVGKRATYMFADPKDAGSTIVMSIKKTKDDFLHCNDDPAIVIVNSKTGEFEHIYFTKGKHGHKQEDGSIVFYKSFVDGKFVESNEPHPLYEAYTSVSKE